MFRIQLVTIYIFFLLSGFVAFPANTLYAKATVQHNIGHYKPDFFQPIISPDGKYMVTTGDNRVKIWDTEGNLIGTFIDDKPYINPPNEWKYWNPNRNINAVAFLPDSRHVAVSVFPRRVYILDLTGNLLKRIKVPEKKLEPGAGADIISKILYFPDGKNILTFEPAQYDIVIRDSNFHPLRRLDMRNGTWVIGFSDIRIDPRGEYFVVVQNHAVPSKNGWNAVVRLYDRRGNFIRDLETDRPGRIKTAHGRIKKYFFKPERITFSPDGKYIAYLGGNARVSHDDPLGRTYQRKSKSWKNTEFREKYRIYSRIRRVHLATGRQFETLVLHKSGPTVKRVFFSNNGNEYIGLGSSNIYRISFSGEVKTIAPHQKIELERRNGRKYQRTFSSSYQTLANNRNTIVGSIDDPLKGMVVYDLTGKIKKIIHPPKIIPRSVYMSHQGRYLSFEIERAKKTILWDTNKNRVTTEAASIFFDNWNKQSRLSHNRKKYINTISINGESLNFNERETRNYRLMILPNRRYADLTNGFTLFNNEGDALRRYPKAKIGIDTVVHPKLKYYIAPDTSAKYKTVELFNLSGKRINRFYVGAFFSFAYTVSPLGEWIVGGHDSAGYIQVWNNRGKLLHRLTDQQSVAVKGLAVTKKRRFLLSSGADGTIKLLDMKTKNLARITLLEKNRFIVSDKKGRVDCSDNARSLVSIVKNGKNRSAGLWSHAYTPGLLRKFLKGK